MNTTTILQHPAAPRTLTMLRVTRQSYLDAAVSRFPLKLTFAYPDGTLVTAALREDAPGIWLGVVETVRPPAGRRPLFTAPYGLFVAWDRKNCLITIGLDVYPITLNRA